MQVWSVIASSQSQLTNGFVVVHVLTLVVTLLNQRILRYASTVRTFSTYDSAAPEVHNLTTSSIANQSLPTASLTGNHDVGTSRSSGRGCAISGRYLYPMTTLHVHTKAPWQPLIPHTRLESASTDDTTNAAASTSKKNVVGNAEPTKSYLDSDDFICPSCSGRTNKLCTLF